MNYLLDTQAFIWWDNNRARLSAKALSICLDKSNLLMVSVASIWELQIKIQLGKLTLPTPLQDMVSNQTQNNGLYMLPVELVHIYGLAALPNHHRDPFDRLIVSQAIVENMALISSDSAIPQYPVTVIW